MFISQPHISFCPNDQILRMQDVERRREEEEERGEGRRREEKEGGERKRNIKRVFLSADHLKFFPANRQG
jgi:hypothetical protein